MFRRQYFKPAVILVMVVVAALFALANCSGDKKPAPAASPAPTASAKAAGIAFTTSDVAVGDGTGLATEVYALKLSHPNEMIKYAAMYSLTSEQFNLVDRYNEDFYADKVSLLLLCGGPKTARFEVQSISLEGTKLVVHLNEVLDSTKDSDIFYRGLVVEAKAADVNAARTAVVQLHQEIG